MSLFWTKYRPIFVLFLFLSLSLFIFTRSLRYQIQARPNHLKMILSTAGYPLQKLFHGTINGIVSGWKKYLYLIDLEQENEVLRRQLAKAKSQLNQYRELKSEYERMYNIMEFRQDLELKTVPANIIGYDSLNWFQSLTLDRGTRDGAGVGMAVINQDGVVGQITACGPHTSTLLPIIQAESGVAGIVQVSRIQGTVVGRSDGLCMFKYVDRKAVLSKGDLLVTSGFDRIFPKGLPIGHIIEVKKNNIGLFLEVKVEPVVNFSRLEEVLIVISKSSDNPTSEKGELSGK